MYGNPPGNRSPEMTGFREFPARHSGVRKPEDYGTHQQLIM
jgi:hypothetical protein